MTGVKHHDDAAFAADIAGAGLVAPQEARVQYAHRLACVGPRGACRADELSALRIRGDLWPHLVGERICRARRVEPAKPDGLFLAVAGPVRHVSLYRSGR